MKLISAIKGKHHDLISVYQSSNSFGDQILLYEFESHDGRVFEYADKYPENGWVQSEEALAIACRHFRDLLNDEDKKYHEHYKIFNF